MNEQFLHQFVKPFRIFQKFGENRACIPIGGGKVIACDGNNPPPGYKSLYGFPGHKGIDVPAYHGQPVYCACDGVVYDIDTKEKSGLDVKVLTERNGEKYLHVYEHLLGYQPKKEDKIKTGDLIGWADNTGYSAGDHLHFELKIWSSGNWKSIDPEPFLTNLYALDVRGIVGKLKELSAQLADWLAELLRK